MNIEVDDLVYKEYTKQISNNYHNITEKDLQNYVTEEIDRHLNSQLWGICSPGYERDRLTNVKTRYYLERQINKYLNEVEDRRINLTLLVIDLKNLRSYNDNYGLGSGDKLIRKVANHLKKIYNDGIIYRFGGEEFVVDLTGIDYREVADLSEIAIKKSIIRIDIDLPNINSAKNSLIIWHMVPFIISYIHHGIVFSATGKPEVIHHQYKVK